MSDVLRAQFELASAIAEQVPVFLARVPWGPPFRSDIAPAICGGRSPSGNGGEVLGWSGVVVAEVGGRL